MRIDTSSARRAAREAAALLEEAGVPEATASAEVLLSELLGIRRGEIALHGEPLIGKQLAIYEDWISRRRNREPVQRILGYAYFRNLRLKLNDAALVPRSDTESVVDAALELMDRRGNPCRVLDLGTGSGAIAISIAQERPRSDVHATDASEAALEVARHNAETAEARVFFYHADVVSDLEHMGGSVDLLISNPPYIRSDGLQRLAPEVRDWDPPAALDGGPDGLAFYRRVFAEVPPLLRRGADIVLEVGDGQDGAVLELGKKAGFTPLGTRQDLTGTPRAVLLRWDAK